MLKCLIVEDQILFADLLSGMLQASAVIGSVHTVHSIKEAEQWIDRGAPDILILDLILPDGNGQEVGLHLIKNHSSPAIILLSSQLDDFICEVELLPYVHAVINKTSAYKELAEAISSLARERQLNDNIGTSLTRLKLMSAREQEVFVLIGKGKKSSEISSVLNISISTVESHRKSIAQCLGTSGADLVRIAAVYCYKAEQGHLATSGCSPAQVETRHSAHVAD